MPPFLNHGTGYRYRAARRRNPADDIGRDGDKRAAFRPIGWRRGGAVKEFMSNAYTFIATDVYWMKKEGLPVGMLRPRALPGAVTLSPLRYIM